MIEQRCIRMRRKRFLELQRKIFRVFSKRDIAIRIVTILSESGGEWRAKMYILIPCTNVFVHFQHAHRTIVIGYYYNLPINSLKMIVNNYTQCTCCAIFYLRTVVKFCGLLYIVYVPVSCHMGTQLAQSAILVPSPCFYLAMLSPQPP